MQTIARDMMYSAGFSAARPAISATEKPVSPAHAATTFVGTPGDKGRRFHDPHARSERPEAFGNPRAELEKICRCSYIAPARCGATNRRRKTCANPVLAAAGAPGPAPSPSCWAITPASDEMLRAASDDGWRSRSA